MLNSSSVTPKQLKQVYDVIIVGAGPAGAVLAYDLARRGVDTLLLEKEGLPRYKCCAGGLTAKVTKLLDFDISGVVEDVVHRVSFTFGPQRAFLRQHDQPLMYTVMRYSFDDFLARKAQQAGAVIVDSQEVVRVQAADDWVEISTTTNAFRTRVVVGADGAYSVVARELGIDRRIDCAAGMESEVLLTCEDLAAWRSTAQMELGLIRGGYAWVFPKREHLSVGTGSLSSGAKHLRQQHQEFLNSIKVGKHSVLRCGAHLIPTYKKGSLLFRDQGLLVGDAAGLVDPLTGEGIHNAVLSAQLAAQVIESRLAHGSSGLDAYQQAIEEGIVPELKTAGVLSRLFIRFPHLSFEMLRRSDGAWKACCGLVLGDLKYADIKGRAGGFRGILDRLLKSRE